MAGERLDNRAQLAPLMERPTPGALLVHGQLWTQSIEALSEFADQPALVAANCDRGAETTPPI